MQTTHPQLPYIRLRLVYEPPANYTAPKFNAPSDVAMFLEFLKESPEEQFVVVHLNANNEPIGLQVISHGTLSSSLVHPREVFKGAIINNSYAIIVAHNHPSGSELRPSKEDLETTEQLYKAGELLGVKLLDHLIVGPGQEAYSIRECRPECFGR